LFELDQCNVYRDIRYIELPVRSRVPLPQNLYNPTRGSRTVGGRYFILTILPIIYSDVKCIYHSKILSVHL